MGALSAEEKRGWLLLRWRNRVLKYSLCPAQEQVLDSLPLCSMNSSGGKMSNEHGGKQISKIISGLDEDFEQTNKCV